MKKSPILIEDDDSDNEPGEPDEVEEDEPEIERQAAELLQGSGRKLATPATSSKDRSHDSVRYPLTENGGLVPRVPLLMAGQQMVNRGTGKRGVTKQVRWVSETNTNGKCRQ